MILLLDVATRSERDQDALGCVFIHIHVAGQGRNADRLQFSDNLEDSKGIFYCLQSFHGHKDTNTTQLVPSVLDKNTLAQIVRYEFG